MDHFAAIAAQRRSLADTLDTLSDQQWATQSLCEAWTVHDVVAHLVMPFETSNAKFATAMIKARGRVDVAITSLTSRVAQNDNATLVSKLRAGATNRFTPPGNDSLAPLTDAFAHSQDICLALDIDTPGPSDQWGIIVEFLTTPKARRGFLSRDLPAVSLQPDDADVVTGSGPAVVGPARAIALCVLGRHVLDDQLSGPGLPMLLGAAS